MIDIVLNEHTIPINLPIVSQLINNLYHLTGFVDELALATESMKQAEKDLKEDILRPIFHFIPPTNWMNDPNGTIWIDGVYHLFYQLNPYESKWGKIHWGHAKSTDLVHWEHLPIALAPTNELGEHYCFSGCCVLDQGTPIIFYTSISSLRSVFRGATQWKATSENMIDWNKSTNNPVMTEKIHPRGKVYEWRDPYVWEQDGYWYMVLCGKDYLLQPRGRIYLYKSSNLDEWEYITVLAKGPKFFSRGVECPNFFSLGKQWVLIVSPYGPVSYTMGSFSNEQFTHGNWFTFDHNSLYYATNTWRDDQDRLILVGWLKIKGKGWAGCLSLPRVLGTADGYLNMKFIPELETLRGAHHRLDQYQTAEVGNNAFEMKLHFEWEKDNTINGITITSGKKSIDLMYMAKKEILWSDKQYKLQFPEKNKVDIHLFYDRSVLEIIVNERESITIVFDPGDLGVKVIAFVSEKLKRANVDLWEINQIW